MTERWWVLGVGPGSCALGNLRGDPLITPTRALTPKAQLNQKPLARSPWGRVPRCEVRRPLNVQPKCSLNSLLKYWVFFFSQKKEGKLIIGTQESTEKWKELGITKSLTSERTGVNAPA